MNRKYLYPILVVLVTILLYYADEYVDRENESYPQTSKSKSGFSTEEFNNTFLPSSTTGVVVDHEFYSLSYAELHEQSEWVAYALTRDHLVSNNFERPYFIEDRSVKSKSADWRNYKNSGYDRGHLCPAGDRQFNYDAFHETFLTSNISPQDPKFNAGIWNSLEQKVRFWAEKYDGVYVITGGILEEGLLTIGDERVSVPKRFYKIVVDATGGNYKSIAFIIPNTTSNASFYDFVVNIDEIEDQTGIDFFPKFSEEIEKEMEATIDIKAWGKR